MDYFNRWKKSIEEAAEGAKDRFSEAAKSAEPYREKFNKTYESTSKTVNETVRVNGPKIKEAANRTYSSAHSLTTSVGRFTRYTRYSMVAAGAGIFLFGVGYAARPIADIYREHRKRIEE
jgi:hypothetical protein